MNNKTIFQRLVIGFKKGVSTPNLPDNILKLQLNPLIRILRFLGGVSFLFILGNKYLNYPVYFLYISMFIAILFTIYHLFISYFRFKHIYKILKSNDLEIRNSL
jgi:hypothetical protein